MSQTLSYSKIADARAEISDIYDNAEQNLVVEIARAKDEPVAVIRKSSLIELLLEKCKFQPQVHFAKDGSVSTWLEGLPVSAEAESLKEAELELISALRDFSQIWLEDLKEFPHHRENWALPTLVRLSTDQELLKLVFGNDE